MEPKWIIGGRIKDKGPAPMEPERGEHAKDTHHPIQKYKINMNNFFNKIIKIANRCTQVQTWLPNELTDEGDTGANVGDRCGQAHSDDHKDGANTMADNNVRSIAR